jgi:hypothetical protein
MPLLQIKSCSKCGAVKPADGFYSDPRTKEGLKSECKICHHKGAAAGVKKSHATNLSSVRAAKRKWKLKNPDAVSAGTAYRRARALSATMTWADPLAIESIYREARRLTKETGILHHVDHEIPLQGDLVSGLHVEFNLRAIPATENLKKSNKYAVEP